MFLIVIGSKKMRGRYSFKIPLEETKILLTFESEINKQKGNQNKAFHQILNDNIDMKKAISEKDKELQDLKEYKQYILDIKKRLDVIFPQCDFSYLIEGELWKRECSLNNVDRGFNLPKEHGKFIADDPKKCENCKAGVYKKFKKKHISPKQGQSKPYLPTTQRRCDMYDGQYVSEEICRNCKQKFPTKFIECIEKSLKNR